MNKKDTPFIDDKIILVDIHDVRPKRHKYITAYKDKYVIFKNRKYYGIYPTLHEAKIIRNKLIMNNWNKKGIIPPKKNKHIRKTKHGYTIGKTKNGHTTLYGVFKTIEEARRERDLLVKYEWDIDTLCDLN